MTILWGVLFPILTQLVKGESRTIGRPYYDFFLRSFGLPLLLLMGIGPLIAWRRTSVRALARAVAWPLGGAVVAGLALVAVGAGSSTPGLIAYTFSAFVLGTIAVELIRGTRAAGSLFLLVSRNRRRYGGYIVHASVVLLAIGVAGSSAYGSTTERKLVVGQSMHVPGYTLTLRGLTVRNTSNATETRAVLGVNGRWRGTISSGANQYRNPPEPSNEVGIKTNWLRGEDLYVIASGFNQKQHAVYVKVLVKPLVNLIWIAGIVFLLGSVVAIWPDAREQRRLVTRLAPARA
jgi:cytochrome c-type biogenesis protein CcmF